MEVHDRRAVLRRVRLGHHPRMVKRFGDRSRVAAVSFEKLRLEHQCPERLARHLYEELDQTRKDLARTEALLAIASAHRNKAEKKLAPLAPRRVNRDREEN